MKLYIRSAACISPAFPLEGREQAGGNSRRAVGDSALQKKENGSQNSESWLRAIEPDYSRYIDPKMIRRMSRIVKLGVSTALQCLKDAGSPLPGALITGTAYGCLEDTGIFLRKMIGNKEELLSPTAFIQSTHNTVGAQVALLLKCHSYNNTIVHRAFSLEHSITEAAMLLDEGMGPVLVGAIDEMTSDSFALLRRFGLFRRRSDSEGPVLARDIPGGEGAAFFLLQSTRSDEDLARIDHVGTRYAPSFSADESLGWIEQQLNLAGINHEKPVVFLDGSSGLPESRLKSLFPRGRRVYYKTLCGEYPTASGFALFTATGLSGGESARAKDESACLFTRSAAGHHSLIYVSPC